MIDFDSEKPHFSELSAAEFSRILRENSALEEYALNVLQAYAFLTHDICAEYLDKVENWDFHALPYDEPRILGCGTQTWGRGGREDYSLPMPTRYLWEGLDEAKAQQAVIDQKRVQLAEEERITQETKKKELELIARTFRAGGKMNPCPQHEQISCLYVFVRKDIPLADQLVQSSHACLEAGRAFLPPPHTNVVLLAVENETSLLKALEDIVPIKYEVFFEPDPIDDGSKNSMGYTAACTEPISGDQKRLFRKFKMWKAPI